MHEKEFYIQLDILFSEIPYLETIEKVIKNELLIVNGFKTMVTVPSAESHVSHVLSNRMSSRPMRWSQTGADRMSKLRCYERNRGNLHTAKKIGD